MVNEGAKTIDELRSMITSEIMTYFKVSVWTAADLVGGLNPKYFDVLTDNSLTAKEMASKTGLCRRTAEAYRCALLKVGLAERKREYFSLEETYFSILDKLVCPKSYEQLEKETGIDTKRLKVYLRELGKLGELNIFRLANKGIFGDLANKSYVYARNKTQEKAAAAVILHHLPSLEDIGAGKLSASLTQYLKESHLTPSLFERLYVYYRAESKENPSKVVRSLHLDKLLSRYNKLPANQSTPFKA